MQEADIWATRPATPIWENVDRATFAREIQPRSAPAVLKGLVRDWPAVQHARQSDAALARFLASNANETPAEYFTAPFELQGRYGFKPNFSGFNFERKHAPLKDILAELLRLSDTPQPASLYAGAVNIPKYAPALAQEHVAPVLDAGAEKLVSLWVGNRGRAAAHWDLPQNLACVVAGRRRFTLFPTAQVKNLYIGPLDVTIAGQPTSLVDFRTPDFVVHPKFAEAIEHAEIAELEPGDALYLPSLWIHHVEALDPFGVMMNFWWRDGPEHLVTPFFTLLHSLLTIRGLPANEREAWRTMFEHFVFEQNGDPFAHLPDHARGVFGAPTPERLNAVRERLLRTLMRR